MKALRFVLAGVAVTGLCFSLGCGPKGPQTVPEAEAPKGAARAGVGQAPTPGGTSPAGAQTQEAAPQSE